MAGKVMFASGEEHGIPEGPPVAAQAQTKKAAKPVEDSPPEDTEPEMDFGPFGLRNGEWRDKAAEIKPGQWTTGEKTKNGYFLPEVVSALQKSVRRGQERETFFWGHEMIVSGYSRYFWNRMGVIVSEDISLADPNATMMFNTFRQFFAERLRSWTKGPFNWQAMSGAVLVACRAKKNRETDEFAMSMIEEKEKLGWRLEMPDYCIDLHTPRGKQLTKKWSTKQTFFAWMRMGGEINNISGTSKYIEEYIDMFERTGWIGQEDADELKAEWRKKYGLKTKADYNFNFDEPVQYEPDTDWQAVCTSKKDLKRKEVKAKLEKKRAAQSKAQG